MKNNPQIAIMMPVYNGEKTLPLAIKSIQAQTYQNWKCYIVNDGSSDRTKQILDALEDERFVVIHFNENKGRPYARQAALDAAEGKYIAFLDADDFFHPEKLEKQVKILEENTEIDLVSCGNLCYGNNYDPISYRGLGDNIIEAYIETNNLNLALRTSLLRLDLCKKIKFNLALMHAQDTDFLKKYLPNRKYLIQDEILYYYSEFESVDKFKILKTNFYGIILHASSFKKAPIRVTKSIIKNLGKISIKLMIYPFVDADFYLKKRGDNITKKQQNDFKEVLNAILKF